MEITSEREWVLEAVRFYRPLDFFREYSRLSDEQLTDELIARNKELAGQNYLEMFLEAKAEAAQEHEEWEIYGPEAIADMDLIRQDANRIWWQDGETDIVPDGEIYCKFLDECCRISRGAFVISNIQEKWKRNELECVVLDWNGEQRQIFPGEMYGWIDFEILTQINELICESGYQFFTHPTGDQTTFMIVLAESEKQKFEAERNWSFYEDEDEE